MRDEQQQPGRTHGRRAMGVAALAAAAAVTAGVAPAASAQTSPAQPAPAHALTARSLTARSLMARSTPASAAARLARSPYTLPGQASVRPDAATAGNLATTVSLSSTNIWALGSTGAAPFAEHYNGHSWLTVKMPAPAGSTETTVGGVTALSATDLWAVGNYLNAAGDYATFSERWNGTKWTEVTSPNPNSTYSAFQGVEAISATKVLATGAADDSAGFPVMLSETWNGSTWTQQPTPLPGGYDSSAFDGLSAISPTNVWAYGFLQSDSFALSTVAAHWNGKEWSLVSTPNPSGNEGDLLAGMDAQSASNIWTVGLYLNSAGDGDTLTEHYNGTAWSIVTSPNGKGAQDSQLTGVAAPSATDAWAVGETNPGGTYVTLREHWDGTTWALAQG